jgi:hypothetical protein
VRFHRYHGGYWLADGPRLISLVQHGHSLLLESGFDFRLAQQNISPDAEGDAK